MTADQNPASDLGSAQSNVTLKMNEDTLASVHDTRAHPVARPSVIGGAYSRVMAVKRTRAAKAARKRKRRMDRVDHDLSDEQWTAIKTAWGGSAYCGATGVPLQRDCVLPISRGGRYTLDNIVPACRSCNASKCNDEVTGWLRRKKLDERRFLLRQMEINAALV